MKQILTFLLVIGSVSPAIAQNSSWLVRLERIKPFVSNERDVEAILGRPKERYSNIGEYEIREGTVSVYYSRGKCDVAGTAEFDVEKGIVISFDFEPKGAIKFASLGLDLSKYEKELSSDVVGASAYYSPESGIYFDVFKGAVKFVQFSGAKSVYVRPCAK